MQDLRKRWQLIFLLILPFFVFQSRQDVRTRGWHCPDWVGCDGPKHHSQHVSCPPDPTTKSEFHFTNFSSNQNESCLFMFHWCFFLSITNNMIVTCFHEFRVHEFFSCFLLKKNFSIEIKEVAKTAYFHKTFCRWKKFANS